MAMNPARWQALFFVAITVAAAVVASGIAAALAQKYSIRSDLAVMGGQRLSERTRKILSTIEQPTRLVIASDLGTADRTARERLTDVLAELSHLIRRLIGENIELAMEHGRDLASVRAFLTSLRELQRQSCIAHKSRRVRPDDDAGEQVPHDR